MTFSFHRLARIDATAGLQISQPWPRPWPATSSLNVRNRLILTIWNSSCRVYAKCSQRLLLTFLPAAASSALSRSVTKGIHPPQPVPAFVHDLTSPIVASPWSRIAARICALLTLLHEQTWAVSAIAPPAPPD